MSFPAFQAFPTLEETMTRFRTDGTNFCGIPIIVNEGVPKDSIMVVNSDGKRWGMNFPGGGGGSIGDGGSAI